MTARMAAQDVKTILVLHSYGQDAPGRPAFDIGFARAIREAAGVKVDLYVETIDPNRFGGEPQARLTRDYLRQRYAGKNIAALAVVYDSALAFVLDERAPLFPDVPIGALLTSNPQSLPDRVTVITSGGTIGKSVALAAKLNPLATEIAVVNGAPPNAARDAVSGEIRRQVQALGLNLPIRFLIDLPLDQLLERMQALPPTAIILMGSQYIGRGGEPIAQADAIRELSNAAPAPIYVTRDQLIGLGAVGGVVINVEDAGADLAELALRISVDGAQRIPSKEASVVSMFDWRQLRRWGISEARLPTGSVVRFRQVSMWDQYQRYILAAIAIIALQSALIGGLMVQRARRRRTEDALRRSYERNQDLAGRLINAQEDERARIARDLHDDLSQQLAGLAIMMNGFKRRVGTIGSQPDLDTVASMQERTEAAADTVRNLSHQLHPGMLEHFGLVAALRRHCQEIQQQHALAVAFDASDDLEAVNPDLALCLFRVSQEALENAVRHGRARGISVQLLSTAGGVELSVSDDGIGFVASERTAAGLGLRSIDERVRLLRGDAIVESRPGHGTRLLVRIPRTAPEPA